MFPSADLLHCSDLLGSGNAIGYVHAGAVLGENASQIEPALIRIIKDGTIYWGKDNSLMIDNDMNNHNLATLVQQLEAKNRRPAL